jgi:ABC-type glycerol-3-phosphate transport system permease component/peptidoglycan/LPS O-acetylase OafA/YrhL
VAQRAPILFIAPFFALLIAFGIVPLAFSLVVSFTDWNPTSGVQHMKWAGLWAYQYTAQDGWFWTALVKTLRVALFSAIPQHLIAIPLAFILHMAFKRVQGVLGTLFFLPYMTSSLAAGAVLSGFFYFLWHILTGLLEPLNAVPIVGWLIPQSFLPLADDAYTAFVQLWTTVGWNVLLYLMVLNVIPRSLYEAAQLDGAGFWRMFRHIALPLMRPMIFVAFTMSFLRGLQVSTGNWFSQSFDPRTTDLPTYIIRTGFWDFDMGLASEMTWVFFLGMVAVTLVVYSLIGRNFTGIDTSAQTESDAPPMRWNPVALIALKLIVLIGAGAAILPMLMIVLSATRDNPSFSSSLPLSVGDSLWWNVSRIERDIPGFWRNLWNSAYISTLATLGAVLVSSLAGYAFTFLQFKWRSALYAVVLGVMLFPSLLNLIPTALSVGVIGWTDQARAVWVPAMASAFGIFLVRQYLSAAVPHSLLEAARIDGASEWMIYASIVLPIARPVLATLGLITFVNVWNNTSAALVTLRNPDVQMVTQLMSVLSGKGGASDALAVGTAISTSVTLILFLVTASQIAKGMNIAPSSDTKTFSWKSLFSRTFIPSYRDDGTNVPDASRGTPSWTVFSSKNPRVLSLTNENSRANREPSPVPNALLGADGIRAVACLMVVFHHLSQRLNMPEQTRFVQEAQSFIMTGSVGVSAFFVLSGMLLSMPFWKRYLEQKPFPDMADFTRRRALRIAPGFYASLLVSFVLTMYFVPDVEHPWIRLLSGLTFTSAFHYITLFPVDLNGPLWSIGFEVFCYALMPIGMWVLYRIYPPSSATLRSSKTAFAFWIGILALTLVAHQLILTDLVPDNVNRGWDHGLVGGAKYWMPHYNAVGMFAHYVLGVLAAGFIAQRQISTRRSSSPSSSWTFDLIALVAFAGLVTLLWNVRHAPDFVFSLGQQPYFYPVFPGLVAVLLATLPFSRLLGRLVDNAFFRYTAKISFGLYIWHFLILELIRLLVNTDFRYFGISSLPYHLTISAIALVLAYIAAGWSYKHIEAPFLPGKKPTNTARAVGVETRAQAAD